MDIPMHRFKYTKLTKEQIGQKLKATEAGPKCASEFSGVLAGKSFKIVTKDGPILDYSFNKKNKLTLSENGGKKVKSGYGALTLKQMVFFSHMIPEEQKGYNVFVDLDTNLVTVIEVWLSSDRKEMTLGRKEITVDDREVQRQIYFGYLENEGKEVPENLHHYTNRIEGKGMYWKQDTGIETLTDLKGKVVYVAQKANPMFWEMAKQQLASVGMTADDLKAKLTFGVIRDAARDMIEGRVDAMLCPVVPSAVRSSSARLGHTA